MGQFNLKRLNLHALNGIIEGSAKCFDSEFLGKNMQFLNTSETSNNLAPQNQGLYDKRNEKDACGVGFVAHIKGTKSHAIVQKGLELLTNLTHRGATGYDPKLGDGAGLLMQLPDAFMRKEAAKLNIQLPDAAQYAVGNVFLPQTTENRKACEALVTKIIAEENQTFLGWRDVPVDNSNIAQAARDVEPTMRQVIIASTGNDQNVFERKLFVISKRI